MNVKKKKKNLWWNWQCLEFSIFSKLYFHNQQWNCVQTHTLISNTFTIQFLSHIHTHRDLAYWFFFLDLMDNWKYLSKYLASKPDFKKETTSPDQQDIWRKKPYFCLNYNVMGLVGVNFCTALNPITSTFLEGLPKLTINWLWDEQA